MRAILNKTEKAARRMHLMRAGLCGAGTALTPARRRGPQPPRGGDRETKGNGV